MKLSIVIPIYNVESLMQELHLRVTAAAKSVSEDYEILYVNDASPDGSLPALLAVQQSDPHVTVIDLAHNFGQHPALMTGLRHARGEFIYVMDCDLEEDPAWLLDFYNASVQNEADLVLGIQTRHRGKGLDYWLGTLFFWSLTHIFKVENAKSISSASLMTRRFVNTLLQYGDKRLTLFAIGHRLKFKRAYVQVKKGFKGESSYTLYGKFIHSVEYITCATSRPLLWVCFYNAGALFTLYPLAIAMMVASFLFGSLSLTGLLVGTGIASFAALMMGSVSIIAAYLFKITAEVVDRPLTVIKAIHSQRN